MTQLTSFGKEVRRLRLDQSISLKSMADGIGVTSAYLSAVETGRKRVTDELVRKIAMWMSLSNSATELLTEAAEASQPEYKIDVSRHGDRTRETVAMFARSVSELSDVDLGKIKSILEKHRG